MWKFKDFSITQILREINLEYFRSAKYTILSSNSTSATAAAASFPTFATASAAASRVLKIDLMYNLGDFRSAKYAT